MSTDYYNNFFVNFNDVLSFIGFFCIKSNNKFKELVLGGL